jgi:hypothetical protein
VLKRLEVNLQKWAGFAGSDSSEEDEMGETQDLDLTLDDIPKASFAFGPIGVVCEHRPLEDAYLATKRNNEGGLPLYLAC